MCTAERSHTRGIANLNMSDVVALFELINLRETHSVKSSRVKVILSRYDCYTVPDLEKKIRIWYLSLDFNLKKVLQQK